MNSDEQSALRYLHSVNGQLRGLREAKRVYEPQLASNFNPLQLLNLYENDLSRFFADLLRPSGSHGQGNLFLKSFVEHFNFNKPWLLDDHVLVETEALTTQGRRIDVKLTFPDGVLGIENKPWASDQKDQVADYIRDVARYGENHLLIYLSGTGNGPSDFSLGNIDLKNFNLEVISYMRFNDWLKECASIAQSLRVRFFIEEFVNYINKQFGEVLDMGESELIVSDALASRGSLEAALAVSAAIDTVKNRLLEKLFAEFKGLAEQHRPEWIVEIDCKTVSESKYKGISVLVHKDDAYRLRLAFEYNGCGECLVGICKTSDSIPNRPNLFDLNIKMKGTSHTSPYWPWYQNFDPLHWDRGPEAWTQIQSGEMVKSIFDSMDMIFKGLIECNMLDDLR